MEWFWLITFVVLLIMNIQAYYKIQKVDTMMIVMPFLALFMYFIRRFYNSEDR